MPEDSPLDSFRIGSLEPADAEAAHLFHWQITLSEPELIVLAQHHDGEHSYLALHDGSMTWDIPGSPQYLALHLTRNESAGTFRYVSERLPLLPLAQQWLADRGCPTEQIPAPPDLGPMAADSSTRALESKLAAAPGRYKILDHYTDDTIDHETTVLLHDQHPSAARQPYRLLLEQVDLDAFTYTLREGAFETAQAAWDWLQDRPGPLPGPAQATAPPPPLPPAAPHRPTGPKR